MKFSRVFFITLFVFLSGLIFGQQVTLDDLMKDETSSKNRGKKKWVEELSRIQDHDSSMILLKTEFKKFEKSGNWLVNDESEEGILSYQTMKKMYVDRFVSDLKNAGFVLSNSKLGTDSRTLIYSKNEVEIEVLAFSMETEGSTLFLVSLIK